MRSYLFSLLLSLYHPNEINIGKSIDWMCYESNSIMMVQLDTIHPGNLTTLDYVDRAYLKATVIEQYKGTVPMLKKITIYPALDNAYIASIQKMIGKEILVFLKDGGCDKYCTYALLDDTYGIMEVNSPAPRALTGEFKMLAKKDELIGYVKDCVKKLEDKTARPYYLEVPYETEAYGALYSGSSCFLIVPDILYPKATKGMH
jgi:hypothetical protein